MNFENPDNILNYILAKNADYEEIYDFCRELCFDMRNYHKNSSGNDFPSPFVQCILECYRIKNNFDSYIWYRAKSLSKKEINPNSKPFIFSITNSRKETLKYDLYNARQIAKPDKVSAIVEVEKVREADIKTTGDSTKEFCDIDIKKAILSCVDEFPSQYGRSGIAKILKGSTSLKGEFNSASIKSDYYGLLAHLTIAFITSKIDELIDEKLLITKKISFARPVLTLADSAKELLKQDIVKTFDIQKNDDNNIVQIFNLLKKGENVFITGHAGTGKSYILNKIKEKIKNLVLLSTTGIAAVNIKGQTIHSWAGIGICSRSVEDAVKDILDKPSIKNQIQKCKILALDEVSMLDIKTFEYTDAVLRMVRECNEPFGGIQVIFIGDFFQLPPVEKVENGEDETKKYCFESNLWREFNFKTILLKKSYRQNEENFIKALSNMRVNALTKKDIDLLKTRECYFDSQLSQLDNILHIFATNQEADSFNLDRFLKINSPEYKLQAQDGVYRDDEFFEVPQTEREKNILKRVDALCNVEKDISLKTNARVMLLVNLDFNKGLINGSCGVVKEIRDEYVSVLFDNGVLSKITRHEFEFHANNILIAARKQFPLRLAYGITIHKSQGMSLDKLVVDCSRIFENGQAYVALSRIKTLKGLYLINFDENKVRVDNKIVEFYNNLEVVQDVETKV